MPFPNSYGFNVAVSTIAVMIGIGGILLGIGYATNNRKMKEFGKDELNQCMINGILIGSMLMLFLPLGPIPSLISEITLQNGAVQCPQYLSSNAAICFSSGYLTGSGYSFNGVHHSSILTQSTGIIIGLLSLNTLLGLLSSLKISIIAISFSLNQVILPVLNQLQFFLKALTTVSMSVLVQSYLLSAVSATATTAILPVGLVLRTFYPTRKVGGFLIGAVLGLYVVFPLTYVLNASIISSYSMSVDNSTVVALSSSANGLNSYVTGSLISPNLGSSILSGISGYLSQITAQATLFISAMENYLSYFILAAFILPAFSLMITFISIKEFSAILGSEISFNIFDMV
ncbi:MAG: hypothetical protein ACYCO0_00225 [Candidatus Micrarchaeaceae archaeon]